MVRYLLDPLMAVCMGSGRDPTDAPTDDPTDVGTEYVTMRAEYVTKR